MGISNTGNEQFSKVIKNAISRFEHSRLPLVTGFLSPSQQALAQRLCAHVPHTFLGGRPEAIRARLFIGNEEDLQDFVSALYAPGPFSKSLSHRDVLGALMHAGLEREAIGDIICEDEKIYVICFANLAPFIQQEIRQIAHSSVYFSACDPKVLPKPSFESLRINTASLRADCVVAALAHCSRSKAKELIHQGLVKVNDEVLESVKTLCNNDDISIRKVGKFRLGETITHTKKDRLVVQIYKYQ